MVHRKITRNSYNFSLGRKAERLVREMMEELGFVVVPFGYEYLLPQFANRYNLLKGKAGEMIRGQPDFLIVDKKTNYAHFVEVKYRSQGELDEKDVSEYPESWVVMVEPGFISIARADYIINSGKEDCFLHLDKIGPFVSKDKDIILKYVRKTKDYFRTF